MVTCFTPRWVDHDLCIFASKYCFCSFCLLSWSDRPSTLTGFHARGLVFEFDTGWAYALTGVSVCLDDIGCADRCIHRMDMGKEQVMECIVSYGMKREGVPSFVSTGCTIYMGKEQLWNWCIVSYGMKPALKAMAWNARCMRQFWYTPDFSCWLYMSYCCNVVGTKIKAVSCLKINFG